MVRVGFLLLFGLLWVGWWRFGCVWASSVQAPVMMLRGVDG